VQATIYNVHKYVHTSKEKLVRK